MGVGNRILRAFRSELLFLEDESANTADLTLTV